MRKHITFALLVIFVLSFVGLPVQAKKAGEIKDNVYTDNDHGFSFTVPNGWSNSIKKSKYALRISLEQTSAVPPRHFQGDLRDYMQMPDIKVVVDTTSLDHEGFIDMLLDTEFKSKQKKALLKYFRLISKPHEVQKRSKITFAGASATMMVVRQAYSMEVSSRGSDRADVVNDYKTGAIFCTVREGKVYIFHLICEYQTGGPIMKLFDEIINSLKFEKAEKAPADDTSG